MTIKVCKYSKKIIKLIEGDWNDCLSQLEADQALFNCIAFYTQDSARVDRLFGYSGLSRDKWDKKHLETVEHMGGNY